MLKNHRFGLVGAGGIARSHMRNLLRLGDVVVYSLEGAAELSAEFSSAASTAGHSISVVDSLEELLGQVDFVDVVTPTYAHAEVVRAALAAGKDVICEKPLARTDAEADDLVKRAEKAGRRLYPGHVLRYYPQYLVLKQAVDEGQLGDLAVLRFSRSSGFPTQRDWYGDDSRSGGLILDMMIHDLDMARWIAGEVVQVSALRVRSDDGQNPVEAAHVLLTHDSGAISHVFGLWGPKHLPFLTDYSVTGTLGSLSHSSRDEENYIADLATPEKLDNFLPPIDPAEDPTGDEIQEFLSAFSGGPAPRVSAEDGAIAVRIANAARESAQIGQPVELSKTSTPLTEVYS